MKRVLIVTPSWPPVTLPDSQRARMAIPFLEQFGWQPLILRCDPDEQEGFKEEALCGTIPKQMPTWKAAALPRALTSPFGFRQVGWRSLPSLNSLGRRIIEQEKPDLVFITTTMFQVMTLGRAWEGRYRLPYILDFQDPWVPGPESAGHPIPGLKARLSRVLDRRMEAWAVKYASHFLSVSPAYVETLSTRYPALRPSQFSVLPFGAPEADFAYVNEKKIAQSIFRPDDGLRHWVYAGRGGKDMVFSLRSFFLALAEARRKDPVTWHRLRLHFIGTNYVSGRRAVSLVTPVAAACGVGDLVEERLERIGYLESLRCLLDAEALIVPGSEDPAYTASKLYPYILARKPLLAIFHKRSTVCQILRDTQAGCLVTFSAKDSPETLVPQLSRQWFERWPMQAPKTDWNAFSEYSAKEMTRRLCGIFDQVIKEKNHEI